MENPWFSPFGTDRKVLEKTLEPYWDYEGASFVDRLAMGHEFWYKKRTWDKHFHETWVDFFAQAWD